MRLSQIPAPVLAQIEEFIDRNWGKIPVTSRLPGPTMQSEIEKRWGVKLSAAQISRLHHKTVKLSNVQIPLDHARELERQFGSVSTGVKKAVAKLIAEIPKVPEPYQRAYEYLRGGVYDIDTLKEHIRELGYKDPMEVLGVFSKEGVLIWEGNKVRITNKRILTGVEQMMFMGFGW